MKLPEPNNIRTRIENVEDDETRNFLKALYLLSAMPAEMYGKVYPKESEKTHVYGPSHNDAWEEKVFVHNKLIDAVCFRIKTAKKKEKHERTVRLPKKSEPWAEDLHDYFKKQKGEKVFPFMRQDMLPKVETSEVFKGLEKPVKYRNGSHSFGMDDLRKVRSNELIDKYHFSTEDLKEYGAAMVKKTRIDEQRDDSLNKTGDPEKWKEYFWKLYNTKLESLKEKLKMDEVELKSPFFRVSWRKKKEQT